MSQIKRLKIKRLSFGIKKCTGKAFGKKVSFKKGGGVKRSYKLINSSFKIKENTNYFVIRNFVYTAYGNNLLKLVQTNNNEFFYLPKVDSDWIGKCVKISKKELFLGSFIPLNYLNKRFPLFYLDNAKIAKAAGTNCTLMNQANFSFLIKLPSKKKKSFAFNTTGLLGAAGNKIFRFKNKKKAGVNRKLNKRPTVRGVAMNPIDHPHGGGEGKTSGGRPSTSPWGKLTKGVKTRKKRNAI